MHTASFELTLPHVEELVLHSHLPLAKKQEALALLEFIASKIKTDEPGNIMLHGYLTASVIPPTDVPYGEGWARLHDEEFEVEEATIEEAYLFDNSIDSAFDIPHSMKYDLRHVHSVLANHYNDNKKELKFEEVYDD